MDDDELAHNLKVYHSEHGEDGDEEEEVEEIVEDSSVSQNFILRRKILAILCLSLFFLFFGQIEAKIKPLIFFLCVGLH